MSISVIIPNYNHSQYLRQRIDSILNQTYKDIEIIILDDCSTDRSLDIINEYIKVKPEIVFLQNKSNSKSPFLQWNSGVSTANGEFIWIAESDDFADPYFLEKTYGEIMKSEKIGMVCCDPIILNEEKGIEYKYSDLSKIGINIAKKLTIKDLVENHIPNVSSVLFRKAAYLDCGGADPKFEYCGDWFLYLSIMRKWEIVYLPETLSTFRLHKGSHYHDYYKSNVLLKERFLVYSSIIKNSAISAGIMLRIFIGIVKTVILRLIHFLRFPSFMLPEIPRCPKKTIRFYPQATLSH